MKTRNIFILGVALLCSTVLESSCLENEYGTVDLSPKADSYEPVQGTYTFNHPCAMYTAADFARVKASLDDGTAPRAALEAGEAVLPLPWCGGSWCRVRKAPSILKPLFWPEQWVAQILAPGINKLDVHSETQL